MEVNQESVHREVRGFLGYTTYSLIVFLKIAGFCFSWEVKKKSRIFTTKVSFVSVFAFRIVYQLDLNSGVHSRHHEQNGKR